MDVDCGPHGYHKYVSTTEPYDRGVPQADADKAAAAGYPVPRGTEPLCCSMFLQRSVEMFCFDIVVLQHVSEALCRDVLF